MVKPLTKSIILSLLPRRSPDAHKGDFGKLLILAGSSRYRGAAQLGIAVPDVDDAHSAAAATQQRHDDGFVLDGV